MDTNNSVAENYIYKKRKIPVFIQVYTVYKVEDCLVPLFPLIWPNPPEVLARSTQS